MVDSTPIIARVLEEEGQGHSTRKNLYLNIEKNLGRPVVSFFTSFNFPVNIENDDADMLIDLLQKMDLSNGLALMINSPGGDGLAAERIIQICRSYSKTKEFWAIAPSMAKSAATMICFGASKIMMGPASELGPIDPQISIEENGKLRRFSVCNLITSYEDLFEQAVSESGNLEPYLLQLSNYDAREIQEYRAAVELSEDIAVKTLASGMMSDMQYSSIKKKIQIFLSPETVKTHSRPIYRDEARKNGLNIECMDVTSELWKNVYEVYLRLNYFVSTKVSKCFESAEQSFVSGKRDV